MDTISYRIGLDILTDKAKKEITKVSKRIEKLESEAVIAFEYDGNYKALNAMLRKLEKKVPELPIDFRIGTLNEALSLDKLKIDNIRKQIEDEIGNPVESIKKIFDRI